MVGTEGFSDHGAAVTYAACIAKVGGTIFLPETPNPLKRTLLAVGIAVLVSMMFMPCAGYLGPTTPFRGRLLFFMALAWDLDIHWRTFILQTAGMSLVL